MQVLESLRTLLSARRTDAESIITTAVQTAADGGAFDVDVLLAALTTKGQSLSDFERLVEIELDRRAAVAMLCDADELRPEVEAAEKHLNKSRLALTKAEAAFKAARQTFEDAYGEQRRLLQHESSLRFRAEQKLSILTSK
ncbi:MAG: hypothetical protein Q8K78_11935 [Planctomycetaceae bacterium]|nr:hypothetical protein [Planctomycetaceae bacterium]